jgi:hypothetical protein
MRYKVYICPTCKGRYRKSKDAYSCIKKHQPLTEDWWECHKCGYGIRVDNRTENSLESEIRNHNEIYCLQVNKYELWKGVKPHGEG